MLRFAGNALPVLALAVALLWCVPAAGAQKTKVSAAFGGDCEQVVLDAISRAKRELHIAVYSFTRKAIAEALVEARRRGVKVRLKMDAHQAKSKFASYALQALKDGKIEPQRIVMPPYCAMHHKFLVVDRYLVVTGSYNFTSKATKENYENVVRIADPAIARRFVEAWEAVESRND